MKVKHFRNNILSIHFEEFHSINLTVSFQKISMTVETEVITMIWLGAKKYGKLLEVGMDRNGFSP